MDTLKGVILFPASTVLNVMISNQTWKWIARATAEATKSNERYRVGAVITLGGAFLSAGHNRRTNNPVYVHYTKCGICAEVSAMKKVQKERLNGAIVYVSRCNRSGLIASAKPCLRCQGYMEGAGISRVYYTVSNDVVETMSF